MTKSSNRIFMSNKGFVVDQYTSCPDFKGAFFASAPTLISDSKNCIEMKIKAPEIEENEIKINLGDRKINIVSVEGSSRKEENKVQLYFNHQILPIPNNLHEEEIDISYQHGILRLIIPKR